ncbi:MAG: glycoside hydrolase family 11 protein, partial [Polyangiaceae bacterium]|nr:glycoside hydrolase family 11 protein [Polyangiaceae bacterium]
MHHGIFLGLTVVLLVGCGAASDEPASGPSGGGSSAGGSGGVSNPATGGLSNPGTGGTSNSGGVSNPATGGVSNPATGGVSTGGVSDPGTGGASNPETGGSTAAGGRGVDTGGATATGGRASGGSTATGGRNTGGGTATGGRNTGGGTTANGGRSFGGGTSATGGSSSGTGGATGTGGGGGDSEVDCSATMPTGGTDHCGANTQGNAGGLSWSLWSNAINGNSCITTFNTTAFSARWSNSGDFLARVGVEWGNSGKTYDQMGTIKAQFAYTRTGNGGGFSYIGIYGWSNNPCVEYYIVEDSFNNFPFNAYNATQTG